MVSPATTADSQDGLSTVFSIPINVNGIDQTLTFSVVKPLPSSGGGGGTTETIETLDFDDGTRTLTVRLSGQAAQTTNIPASTESIETLDFDEGNRRLTLKLNGQAAETTDIPASTESIETLAFNPSSRTLTLKLDGQDAETANIPASTERIETFSFNPATRVLTFKLENQPEQTVNIPASTTGTPQADRFVEGASISGRVVTLTFNDGTTPLTFTVPEDIHVNALGYSNGNLTIGRQGANNLSIGIPTILDAITTTNGITLRINQTNTLSIPIANDFRAGIITGQTFENLRLSIQRSIDAGKLIIRVGDSINTLVDGGTVAASRINFFANSNTRTIEGTAITIDPTTGEKSITGNLIDSVSTQPHYYIVASTEQIRVKEVTINGSVIPFRPAAILGEDNVGHTWYIYQSVTTHNVNTGSQRSYLVDLEDLQGVGREVASNAAPLAQPQEISLPTLQI